MGYNLDQCGYPHKEEEILAPKDLIQHYQEERASLNATVDRAVQQISTSLDQTSVLPDIEYASGALSRLAELDANFADRMIKSVLEMAIRGKLVAQCSEDGTARDLLDQTLIDVEIDGRRVKQKVITEISEEHLALSKQSTVISWRSFHHSTTGSKCFSSMGLVLEKCFRSAGISRR